MAIDIKGYYEQNKGYYGDDTPLDEVAKDVYTRSAEQRPYDQWLSLTGMQGQIEEDRATRKAQADLAQQNAAAERARQTDPGLLSELGRSIGRGITQTVPQQFGKGLQWLDPDGGVDVVERAGKAIEEFGNENVKRFPGLEMSNVGRNADPFSLRYGMAHGGESLVQSAAPAAAVMAGGPIGILGGLAAMGTMYYGGTAEDKYREMTAAGKSPEESMEAAQLHGGIEGGFELIGDLLLKKIFGPAGGDIAKTAAGSVIKSIVGKQPLKQTLKKIGTGVLSEEATEITQGTAQAYVDQKYGLSDQSLVDSAKEVLMPTLVTSAILGVGGAGYSASHRAQLRKALADPTVDPKARYAAVREITAQAHEADPEVAKSFHDKATELLAQNKPIVLDDDDFYATPEAVEPIKPAVDDVRKKAEAISLLARSAIPDTDLDTLASDPEALKSYGFSPEDIAIAKEERVAIAIKAQEMEPALAAAPESVRKGMEAALGIDSVNESLERIKTRLTAVIGTAPEPKHIINAAQTDIIPGDIAADVTALRQSMDNNDAKKFAKKYGYAAYAYAMNTPMEQFEIPQFMARVGSPLANSTGKPTPGLSKDDIAQREALVAGLNAKSKYPEIKAVADKLGVSTTTDRDGKQAFVGKKALLRTLREQVQLDKLSDTVESTSSTPLVADKPISATQVAEPTPKVTPKPASTVAFVTETGQPLSSVNLVELGKKHGITAETNRMLFTALKKAGHITVPSSVIPIDEVPETGKTVDPDAKLLPTAQALVAAGKNTPELLADELGIPQDRAAALLDKTKTIPVRLRELATQHGIDTTLTDHEISQQLSAKGVDVPKAPAASAAPPVDLRVLAEEVGVDVSNVPDEGLQAYLEKTLPIPSDADLGWVKLKDLHKIAAVRGIDTKKLKKRDEIIAALKGVSTAKPTPVVPVAEPSKASSGTAELEFMAKADLLKAAGFAGLDTKTLKKTDSKKIIKALKAAGVRAVQLSPQAEVIGVVKKTEKPVEPKTAYAVRSRIEQLNTLLDRKEKEYDAHPKGSIAREKIFAEMTEIEEQLGALEKYTQTDEFESKVIAEGRQAVKAGIQPVKKSWTGFHKSSNAESLTSGFEQRDFGISVAHTQEGAYSSPRLAEAKGTSKVFTVKVDGKGLDYNNLKHRQYIDGLFIEADTQAGPNDIYVLNKLRKAGVDWVNNFNGIGRTENELHVLNADAIKIVETPKKAERKKAKPAVAPEPENEESSPFNDVKDIPITDREAILKALPPGPETIITVGDRKTGKVFGTYTYTEFDDASIPDDLQILSVTTPEKKRPFGTGQKDTAFDEENLAAARAATAKTPISELHRLAKIYGVKRGEDGEIKTPGVLAREIRKTAEEAYLVSPELTAEKVKQAKELSVVDATPEEVEAFAKLFNVPTEGRKKAAIVVEIKRKANATEIAASPKAKQKQEVLTAKTQASTGLTPGQKNIVQFFIDGDEVILSNVKKVGPRSHKGTGIRSFEALEKKGILFSRVSGDKIQYFLQESALDSAALTKEEAEVAKNSHAAIVYHSSLGEVYDRPDLGKAREGRRFGWGHYFALDKREAWAYLHIWHPQNRADADTELGNMYRYRLPNKLFDKMLDWDLPVKEQTETVQRSLARLQAKIKITPETHASSVYRALEAELGSDKKASLALAEVGIVGNIHRYSVDVDSLMDRSPNTTPADASPYNYVIWDQETLDEIKRLNTETGFDSKTRPDIKRPAKPRGHKPSVTDAVRQPMSAETVAADIKEILGTSKVPKFMHVLAKFTDLPQALQDFYAGQKTSAITYNNDIYFVSEFIENTADTMRNLITHEGGHLLRAADTHWKKHWNKIREGVLKQAELSEADQELLQKAIEHVKRLSAQDRMTNEAIQEEELMYYLGAIAAEDITEKQREQKYSLYAQIKKWIGAWLFRTFGITSARLGITAREVARMIQTDIAQAHKIPLVFETENAKAASQILAISRLEEDFIKKRGPKKATAVEWKKTINSWLKKDLPKGHPVREELFWSNLLEELDTLEGAVTRDNILEFLNTNGLKAQVDIKTTSTADTPGWVYDSARPDNEIQLLQAYEAGKLTGEDKYTRSALHVARLLTELNTTLEGLGYALRDKRIAIQESIDEHIARLQPTGTDSRLAFKQLVTNYLRNVFHNSALRHENTVYRDLVTMLYGVPGFEPFTPGLGIPAVSRPDISNGFRGVLRDYVRVLQDLQVLDIYEVPEQAVSPRVDVPYANMRLIKDTSEIFNIEISIPQHNKPWPEYHHESEHFDTPNQIGWLRAQVVNADGKPHLVILEIQSDLHQTARKSGYQGETDTPYARRKKALQELWDAVDSMSKEDSTDIRANLDIIYEGDSIDKTDLHSAITKVVQVFPQLTEKYPDLHDLMFEQFSGETVYLEPPPPFPFKANFTTVAFKEAIKAAVQRGIGRIIWPASPAQVQQIENWDDMPFKNGGWLGGFGELKPVGGSINSLTRNLTEAVNKNILRFGGELSVEKIPELAIKLPRDIKNVLAKDDWKSAITEVKGGFLITLRSAIGNVKHIPHLFKTASEAEDALRDLRVFSATDFQSTFNVLTVTPELAALASEGRLPMASIAGMGAEGTSVNFIDLAGRTSVGGHDTPGIAELEKTFAPISAKTDASIILYNGSLDPKVAQYADVIRTHEQKSGRVVAGFHHTGRIYINAAVLTDTEMAQRMLLHELVGHYGLRKLMGNRLDDFLDSLVRNERYRDDILTNAERRKIDVSTDKGLRLAAEEWFAWAVETDAIEPTLWTRFMKAVRDALRQLGFTVEFSDTELAEVIRSSYAAAMPNSTSTSPGISFSDIPKRDAKAILRNLYGDRPTGTEAAMDAMHADRISASDSIAATSKDPMLRTLGELTSRILRNSFGQGFPAVKQYERTKDTQTTNIFTRMLSLPEYYLRRDSSAERVLNAALRQSDLKYVVEKAVTGETFIKTLENLQKNDPKSYDAAKKYMLDADRTGIGYSVGYRNKEWHVFSPIHAVIFSFKNEADAVAKMVEQEQVTLKSRGFSDSAMQMVKETRDITNRAFDVLVADMRRQVSLAKENGIPEPQMPITNAEGKREQISLSEAIATMGDLRGTFFPRERPKKGFVLTAEKPGVGKKKLVPISLFLPGNTEQSAIRGALKDIINKHLPVKREVDKLLAEGYKLEEISINPVKAVSEEIFDVPGLLTAVDAVLAAAEEKVEKNSMTDVEKNLLEAISQRMAYDIGNIYKAKGSASSRIKRANSVWEGYEEDPIKAVTSYVQRLAAGVARRTTARDMLEAFTGRDITWAQFQKENPTAKYSEYRAEVRRRAISPIKQRMLHADVRLYMNHVLRPDSAVDRFVGYLKGISVLMFMGLRVSSAAVNMTNMAMAVPATIAAHTGLSVTRAWGHVTSAAAKYAKYRAMTLEGNGTITSGFKQHLGKLDLSLEDRQIFNIIARNGWDQAQFNQDSIRVLQDTVGKAWNASMSVAMGMFGAAERANRAMTIFAATKAHMQANPGMDVIDAVQKAKHTSDRAHGQYGKGAKPWLVQKVRFLDLPYTFFKFQQNYMLNMLELGLKYNRWGTAVPYMLMSPAVLAGAGASLVTPFLAAMFSAGGDDDPEEAFYSWAEETMGSDAFARHGLAGLFGVNLKGSLEITSPFPDLTKGWLGAMGAPGGVFLNLDAAYENFKEGRWAKGVEKLLPSAAASVVKGYREYTEGVTDEAYAPVYVGSEKLKGTPLDFAVRLFSFNPERISGIRQQQWREDQVRLEYQKERSKVTAGFNKLFADIGNATNDDYAKLYQKIEDYNTRAMQADPKYQIPFITASWLRSSIKRAQTPDKYERARMED